MDSIQYFLFPILWVHENNTDLDKQVLRLAVAKYKLQKLCYLVDILRCSQS